MVKHDAHEHGVAEMNLAQIGNEIQIELETPSYNVIGFEHKPKNHEQEEVVHEAIETLDVDSPFGDEHHKEGHKDHHEEKHGHEKKDHHEEKAHDKHDHKEHAHGDKEEETHSEFKVEYHFDCKASDAPLSIDASQLFAKFPNFSEIRVQWLSNSKQGSTELNAKNTVISIK